MRNSKLWLLLKIQLPDSFRGQRQGKVAEKKFSRVGYTILMAVAMLVIVGTVSAAYIGMAFALQPLGLLYIIPTVAAAGGSIFCLFTTIYKTNGLLFRFQDYELIMSLPFPSSTVVAARLLILYVWNLMFLVVVMLPACIVYGIFAEASVWFYVVYIIGMLVMPLIPVVIATFIGALIALAASRFQRKGLAGIFLTLLFLTVWMLFVYNMDTVIENFADIGPVINRVITSVYPPAAWFTQACCDLNMGAFALFLGVSIGLFVVYCWVIGHFYRRINSVLSADRSSSDYHIQDLKTTSAKKALLRKDFKRLISSSNYFMNTCIGSIMVIVMSALMLFAGVGTFGSFSEMADETGSPEAIYAMVTLFMCFFSVLTCTSAVSISLEGRSLWIVRSAPVSSRDILQAKLLMNYLIILVSNLIASTFLVIAFRPSFLWGVFIYGAPLVYGAFTTVFGQYLDLKYANFEWTDETRVVKRSKQVMILSLLGMAITLAPLFGVLFLGTWLAWALVGVLLVLAIFIYRNLMTKGVVRFDSFPA